MNNSETCTYRSSYSKSDDRGADMYEHQRSAHPDHTHVWGPSRYEWEVNRDWQRCTVCNLRDTDVSTCGS